MEGTEIADLQVFPHFCSPRRPRARVLRTLRTRITHTRSKENKGVPTPRRAYSPAVRGRETYHIHVSISSRPLFRRTAIEGLDRRVCICPDHRVFTSIVAERSPECRHVGGVPVLDGAPRRGGSARALNPVPGRLHELIVRELRARDKR